MAVMSDWKSVEHFKGEHKNCSLETKLTNDDKNTVVIRCAYHAQAIMTHIPYRMFCLHPFKCAGHNSCPRNYACSE
jgi:hypothetical protein